MAASFARKHLKGAATIKEYKSTQDHNLESGRIDAIIASNSTLLTTLKGESRDALVIVGAKFLGGSLRRGQGIGFHKEDANLTGAFNGAVKDYIADGTVKLFSEKWFGLWSTYKSTREQSMKFNIPKPSRIIRRTI